MMRSHAGHATHSSTYREQNEILPALSDTLSFLYALQTKRWYVCIINGINCSAKHALFFCFRARTYSYDDYYFCIVAPEMYVIMLYTCVSYVLYVVCDMLLLFCAAPFLTPN